MEEDIKILEKLKEEKYTQETVNSIYEYFDEETAPYVLTTIERQAIENLIARYKELETGLNNAISEQTKLTRENTKLRKEKFDLEKENQSYRDYFGTPPCYDNAKYIKASALQAMINDQLEEADDVLVRHNYYGNFNGTEENQKYYYDGYKDATLFIRDGLLQEGDDK